MKKTIKTLSFRLIGLIILMLAGVVPAMASPGGSTTTYYGKLTATATGGGKVYVSTSQTAPAESAYATTHSATSSGTAQSMTFYLYGTGGPEGAEIQWYHNSSKVAEGNGASYSFNATSTTEGSPTEQAVELRFKVITYPYVEVSGGTTYLYADNKIKYILNSDSTTATVANQEANGNLVGDLTIPVTVTNPATGLQFSVTKMAKAAFKDCPNITGLTFQAHISEFTGSNITAKASDYVKTTASVSGSGAGIFAGCPNLTRVDMRECTFTKTDKAMFAFCFKLNNVVMPNTLTELSGYDFMFCNALKKIDLSHTRLNKICQLTFGQNSITTECQYYSQSGSNYYYQYGVQQVFLPEDTEITIDNNGFLYNTKLQWVTNLGDRNVPTDEQKQKYPYLKNCTSLGGVCHLSNVISLGQYAFTRTYGGDKAWILNNDKLKSIPSKTFNVGNRNHTHVLGKNVTSIESEGMKNNHIENMCYEGMDYEVIKNGTIKIDGREGTGHGILPPKLSSLGSNAIGETGSAFYIQELYLPSTLISFGSNCFNKALSLKHVYAYGSNPYAKNFSDVPSGAVLHIHPDASETNLSSKSLFTVVKDLGHYHNFKAGWNTLTLASHAQQPSGLTFYTISHKERNVKGVVNRIVVEPVSAGELLKGGVPYLVKADVDKSNVLFDYVYGHIFVHTADAINGLHGTLDTLATGLSDVYTFSDGQPVDYEATCGTYSAYIVLDEVAETGTPSANAETIMLFDNRFVWQWYEKQADGTAYVASPVGNVNTDVENLSATAFMPSLAQIVQESEVRVPEKVNIDGTTCTVVGIKPFAFAGQKCIASIELPRTITTVETIGTDWGQGGVVIPELALAQFDYPVPHASGIFYDCFALRSVTFQGNDLTELGSGAFFGCVNLKDVRLPANLRSIGYGDFVACYSLGDNGVVDLSGLTQLKEVGYYAFMMSGIPTGADPTYYLPIPELYDEEAKAAYEAYVAGAYGLSEYHFADLAGTGVRKVILPTSATDICYGAFRMGGQLTDVTQDKDVRGDLGGVQRLGQWVFSDCPLLTEMSLTNSNLVSLPANTFTNCEALTKVTLPTGLKEISPRAFYCCAELSTLATADGAATGTLRLPDGLEHVGAQAFWGVSAARKLYMPDGLKRISALAFHGTNLTEATTEATTAPVLGKTGVGANDTYEEDILGEAFRFMSEQKQTPDLTTVIANPDAFPSYAAAQRKAISIPEGTVKDYDGKGYGQTFKLPHWYERKNITVGNYGTLCVDFDCEQPKGFTFYVMDHRTEESDVTKSISIAELEEDEMLEAGYPYFFMADDSDIMYMEQDKDGKTVDTPQNDDGVYGAFMRVDISEADNIYLLSKNKLHRCLDGSYVSPNRVYIKLSEVPTESQSAGVRPMVTFYMDVATSIEELRARTGADTYDLSGRKVTDNKARGIFIVNGKKIAR